MNRITPLILAVALFMEQMDSTVIATALPTIAADLHVGPITLKLALTAYMVALAIFIPISGWMADRFGAKRIFRAAIVVFMLGSVFCAISGSLTTFVAARFLQGIGGAMMTPVGRLVLLRTTKRSDLVSAMALLTIPGLLGPITGPPVGGFITTFFSWHWIFLINIPIGLAGLWLSSIYLPEIDPVATAPIDWKGFALSSIAASGLVFGLSVMSLPGLPIIVGIGATVTGLLCLLLYVGHARRHAAPLLDLSLFANRSFRASIIGGTGFRLAAGATPFLLPLMLQLGFGMSAFQSGMTTFIAAVGAITTKFVARRVFAAAGFRNILIAAGLGGTLTTAANAFFTPATPIAVIMAFLLIGGFFRSFFFTGVNTLGYAEIDDQHASQATSLTSVLQQISLALGVAVAAAILETSTTLSGGPLSLGDFHVAFAVVAGLSVFAIIPFFGLPRDVGSAVSDYRRPTETETVAVK
ncbi:drug resistance transporter, EmrB/QacA subfamily [Rhizobium sp. PDO1-076]|uniref:DHA2 family efflux MFS transporter permease subunit n=1 Tax=Rhizobium sp. PDO1-076 TaxID=1125979 RepID=UPI00024E29E2|nr:DHA2 family efflux MFS transporter permease subunit [Rhizobium sp. PDO1-076]EHS49849.1 drug resistance transporter, EmrB/QacA subfamily [Rhizobium sp. PDO1-076]